jgi:hypothetical protein
MVSFFMRFFGGPDYITGLIDGSREDLKAKLSAERTEEAGLR